MVQILFAFILIPPYLAKYKKKSTIKIEPKIKWTMKLTIYIFITIHTLCIKRSIIGVFGAKRNYSRIKLCFLRKVRNWIKNPTKNIRRQLHSIPYFCKQKDLCYTKVLQKFSWQNRTISFFKTQESTKSHKTY